MDHDQIAAELRRLEDQAFRHTHGVAVFGDIKVSANRLHGRRCGVYWLLNDRRASRDAVIAALSGAHA